MVSLPENFVAIRYPGYFWNLEEKRLYTMKVTGVLRPITGPYKPNVFNNWSVPCYRVSVNGVKRSITITYLLNLTSKNSTIPMEKK